MDENQAFHWYFVCNEQSDMLLMAEIEMTLWLS